MHLRTGLSSELRGDLVAKVSCRDRDPAYLLFQSGSS